MEVATLLKGEQRPVVVSLVATLLFIAGFVGLAWLIKEGLEVRNHDWRCLSNNPRLITEAYYLTGIFFSMIVLALGFLRMRAWALWGLVLIVTITLIATVERLIISIHTSFRTPAPQSSSLVIGVLIFLIIELLILLFFRKRYVHTTKVGLLFMLAILVCFNFLPLRHIYYTFFPVGAYYWSNPREKDPLRVWLQEQRQLNYVHCGGRLEH